MKISHIAALAAVVILLTNNCGADDSTIVEKQYSRFTIWLDCSKRGAIRFQYSPTKDIGNLTRVNNFAIDQSIPSRCQQKSARSYGSKYDRGHLAPINQFDDSFFAMEESNYMTNILPQTVKLNRTAWLKTEMVTECLRNENVLTVYGGAIYGKTKTKISTQFMESHGVEVPVAFYKIIVNDTLKRNIAWVFPNDDTVSNEIDRYLVSIADINKITGMQYTGYNLKHKEKISWTIPKSCDKS